MLDVKTGASVPRSSPILLFSSTPNCLTPFIYFISLAKPPPQVKAGTPTMHCNPNAGATLSAFLEGVCDGKTLPLTKLLPRCITCMGSGTPLNLNDPTCHTSICSCSTQHKPTSVRHNIRNGVMLLNCRNTVNCGRHAM